MAIGKGLNAFLAAYYKAKESNSKDVYQAIQLAYLMNKLGGKGATGEDAQAQAAGAAAKGAYDRGNVGGLTEGRSAALGHPIGDPVSSDMAPHQRAFLNAVAAPESNGEYDRMYAGMDRSTPPTYFEGYDQHPDIAAAGPAGPSTAAGRYMFTKSTWDRMGGGSFDPASQDQRAWQLAKQDYAARTGGRDLDTELRTNGFTPQIASTLSPTWQGFKANPQLAADTYNSSLSRYNQPQVAEGAPSALPVSPVATAALAAAPLPPPRPDNLGQALPVEAGVTSPTPTAYAPEAYPQAIPVDYAAYDPYSTEAVYAAKGGLVPDLRQRWVQHFQGGGEVEPDTGLLEPGNIDLNTRPVVRNPDGTISTVRSMGVNIDGQEVLLPTVSDDGRIMSDDAAVQQYMQTGRHLGKFRTPAASNAYAQRLHEMQAQQYGRGYARGGFVQHFQGGGDVLPYPPQFTYVDPNSPALGGSPEPMPDQPAQFTYIDPNAPWTGQPMVNNPYGALALPPDAVIGPGDFAPPVTSASYSGNPYGALAVPDRPDVPMPPVRPAGLGAAPVEGGGGGVRRGVPLPPPRPDDIGAEPDQGAPSDRWTNYQISPDNPIAQLLTGVEHAVSGGVRWLTKNLGFNNDAIPTSGDGLRALANGDHALTQEEHDAVVNRVDPDNKLSPGVRNMVGMNAMYEYYLTHGSLDKAQKMAAGMLLYSEQYLRKSGYDALRDPNPASAAKKLADGFNQVPNNQHMTVDDNGNFVLKNETTGKVINAGRYNPQQLLAAATGATNGSVFWQSLSQFAHKDDEVDDKQTAAQKNAQAAAARQENFHKAMGFVPSDTGTPGEIPVSAGGFKALAPDTESATEDAGEGGEGGEGATEGRSAAQGISTTPAGAPPKPTAKTPEWAAYLGKSALLDDNIKTDEQRAAWNALTPAERTEQRNLWKFRIDQAGQAAKREADANAPVPDANKADTGTQGKLDKNVDEAWTGFTTAAEGKKDPKTGEVFSADKIAPQDIQGFKNITRGIVQKHGGSAADALDTSMNLVRGAAKQPVPTKKDANGKDVIDWDKANDAKPYITRTVKGDKWVIPRNEDGVPDPQAAVRISYKGYNTLEKMTKAAVQNKFDAQQEAAKPGIIERATPGLTRAGAGVGAVYGQPLPPVSPQQAAAAMAAKRMAPRPTVPTPVVPVAPAVPPRDWGWPGVR
jgi:muramidase (phage lysozyme)